MNEPRDAAPSPKTEGIDLTDVETAITMVVLGAVMAVVAPLVYVAERVR